MQGAVASRTRLHFAPTDHGSRQRDERAPLFGSLLHVNKADALRGGWAPARDGRRHLGGHLTKLCQTCIAAALAELGAQGICVNLEKKM